MTTIIPINWPMYFLLILLATCYWLLQSLGNYESQNARKIDVQGDDVLSIIDRVRYKNRNWIGEAIYGKQNNLVGWEVYVFYKNEVIMTQSHSQTHQRDAVFNELKEYIDEEMKIVGRY
ncbi:MAG: hypothetical protein ACW99G_13845 [Candidatus Thorarchaeota archaeon]|jgi:hypothetical protein